MSIRLEREWPIGPVDKISRERLYFRVDQGMSGRSDTGRRLVASTRKLVVVGCIP